MQGITPKDYVDQLLELQNLDFDHFAVGGLAFRKKTEIDAILSAISDIFHAENYQVHLLGCGKLDLIKKYAFITSFDCVSPLADSYRDSQGKVTYLYKLDRNRLIKTRLMDLRNQDFHNTCDCPCCKLVGDQIIWAGENNRNRARSFHNAYIFNEYIAKKFLKKQEKSLLNF